MFYETRAGGISHYRFSELEDAAPGLAHAFTSRRTDAQLAEARPDFDPIRRDLLDALRLEPERGLSLCQIHSADVLSCGEADGSGLCSSNRRSGDGILLDEPGRWGVVRTADCVSILLVAPRRRQACLLHAGWRGSRDRIARAGALRLMESSQARADEIVTAFGPAIHRCCYEVGDEVRDQFEAAGHDLDRLFDGHQLDLIQANAAALEELGLRPPLDSGVCTACRSDLFYSWRKKRDTGRMWALAGFRVKQASSL